MKILDLLLPREVEFFSHMNNQVINFSDACICFNELVMNLGDLDSGKIKDYIQKIREYEMKGDKIERFIIMELDRTFITPFDREDIHSIVVNIDHSLDFLHSVSQKIVIYKIRKSPSNLIRFSEIIVRMSSLLKRLIHELKNRKEVFILIKEIHELENEADHLFHITLADLFNTKNATDIIRFKDIYEELENLSNCIDSVSKIVRGIIVKQG